MSLMTRRSDSLRHAYCSALIIIILVVVACLLETAVCLRIDPLEAQQGRREREQPPPHRDLRSAIPNVAVDKATSPDDHLVTDLPAWRRRLNSSSSFPVDHWAGHLAASPDGDKYLFYWLFAPEYSNSDATKVDDADVPLLIWLNGGPGCSSMDGLFLENGPLQFMTDNDDGEIYLTDNPYSWNKAPAYTLYIDQPVGTGLSFTTSRKYPTNDEEVNVDFYYFMMQFLELHADKFVDTNAAAAAATTPPVTRPVYFSGESHAGHYIPSMMNYILKQNAKSSPSSYHITLRGAAIGNGWTDPIYQYAAAEAAYGHGMLDRPQVNALDALEDTCQAQLQKGNFAVSVCFSLLDKVVAQSHGSSSEYKVSTYDARRTELRGASREFPPGHKIVETYLGNWPAPSSQSGSLVDWDDATTHDRVLEALHATAATDAGQRFRECADPPYDALAHLDGMGVVPDVVAVLEHVDDVRLLFFNGMEDLICNHVGNEMFLMKMQWSGQQDWIQALRYAWRAESDDKSKVTGYMKESSNLLFLKLLNAGHMVPLDLPQQSLEMMRIFMYDESFDQSAQTIRPEEKHDTCPVCPSTTCDTCDGCSLPSLEDDDAIASASKASFFSPASGAAHLPWIIAALAVLSLLIVLIRNRKPRQHQELVSQYDLELREGNYSDSQACKTGNGTII